jgi:hypothetical protein
MIDVQLTRAMFVQSVDEGAYSCGAKLFTTHSSLIIPPLLLTSIVFHNRCTNIEFIELFRRNGCMIDVQLTSAMFV